MVARRRSSAGAAEASKAQAAAGAVAADPTLTAQDTTMAEGSRAATTRQTSKGKQPPSSKIRKGRGEKVTASQDVDASNDSVMQHTMPSSSSSTLMWASVVQNKASDVPIVFSHDAEFFFVASASSVKIFANATGKLVSTLSSAAAQGQEEPAKAGHRAAITGMALNPSNVLQLITSSLDGTVKVWDYIDGILVRTISAGYAISHMATHPTMPGRVCVVLRKPRHANADKPTEKGKSKVHSSALRVPCNSIVQVLSLMTATSKGSTSTTPTSVVRIGKTRHASGLAISPDGGYIIVVGKRKIHIASTSESSKGFSKVLTDKNLTCIAFHPTENIFATGNEVGQIRLWYFLSEGAFRLSTATQQQTAPSTLHHWHAHAVSTLTFTSNGAYLVSGGEESVLVLWQLATMSREYVPRLGGASIASVSILSARAGGRQEQYVAALSDGSIIFISATNLKPLRTIAGVLALLGGRDERLGRALKSSSPLAVQPGTGHLVMTASHPTSLQFVDPQIDEQVMQLEVVPSNRVSRPDEAPIAHPRIERVAFSAQAEWMATVDWRPTGESSLKIWRWDTRKKMYMLNTRIDDPHGQGHGVSAIGFSPRAFGSLASSPLLVTLGSDKKGKTWRCVSQDGKRMGQTDTFWIARSAIDYRSVTASCFAFSPDASLLAIGFGACITLWEPLSNTLLHVVTTPRRESVDGVPEANNVKDIIFAGRGGRYMAAITSSMLNVWDAVLGSVVYEAEQEGAFRLLRAADEGFAVVSDAAGSSIVTSYTCTSSKPLTRDSVPLTIRNIAVNDAHKQDDGSGPAYFAVTADDSVVQIGMRSRNYSQLDATRSLRGVSIKRRTLYDELFGPRNELPSSLSSIDLPARNANSTSQKTSAPGASVVSLFDMPAHLLPPVQSLFTPFVQRVLPRKPREVKDKETNSEAKADSDMSSDEDEQTSATSKLPAEALKGPSPGFNLDVLESMFSELVSLPDNDEIPTNTEHAAPQSKTRGRPRKST